MDNNIRHNSKFASLDVEERVKFQRRVKHHVGRQYSKIKDHRQKKSVLSQVKNRLKNAGKHKMRRKIRRMRKHCRFPQTPGPRDKFRQYGFIVRNKADEGTQLNKVTKFD